MQVTVDDAVKLSSTLLPVNKRWDSYYEKEVFGSIGYEQRTGPRHMGPVGPD
jgi:hypothetical protein